MKTTIGNFETREKKEKEKRGKSYKQVAVERKERKGKMGPVDRYIVPMLKWLTGHNVNFHLGCEF